jgi:hypothetical protein
MYGDELMAVDPQAGARQKGVLNAGARHFFRVT